MQETNSTIWQKKSAFTAVKEETTQICSFQRPVQNCIDIGL
jgi:hypothetical protein